MWNDDVYGLARNVEAVLSIDLEEVCAHKCKNRNAVVQYVLWICSRRLCQDQKGSCLGVWIMTCPGEAEKEM